MKYSDITINDIPINRSDFCHIEYFNMIFLRNKGNDNIKMNISNNELEYIISKVYNTIIKIDKDLILEVIHKLHEYMMLDNTDIDNLLEKDLDLIDLVKVYKFLNKNKKYLNRLRSFEYVEFNLLNLDNDIKSSYIYEENLENIIDNIDENIMKLNLKHNKYTIDILQLINNKFPNLDLSKSIKYNPNYLKLRSLNNKIMIISSCTYSKKYINAFGDIQLLSSVLIIDKFMVQCKCKTVIYDILRLCVSEENNKEKDFMVNNCLVALKDYKYCNLCDNNNNNNIKLFHVINMKNLE